MKLGHVCLVLGALPALGQVESTAVYTAFQQDPPEVVMDSMKEEVASIMAPGGLRLNWRSLNRATGSEVFSELAVARFKGKCDGSAMAPGGVEQGALAWSHVSDGVVIPFADVDCDRILNFLRNRLSGLEAKSREKVFGRAMGRVLAHELYHIFARATGHGSRDVDRPYYTVAELVDEDFGFDDSRHHILQLANQSTPTSQDKSPAAKDKSSRSKNQPGLAAFVKSGCSACHGSRGQGTSYGPPLRVMGAWLNSVVLAARLERGGPEMRKRARGLKVPAPSLQEEDIRDVVQFLNAPER